MSERENTELVQRAYGSFRNGDIPAVIDSMSEDVRWVTAEIEGVPVGGTWQGREQVGQFFRPSLRLKSRGNSSQEDSWHRMIGSWHSVTMPGT